MIKLNWFENMYYLIDFIYNEVYREKKEGEEVDEK